MQALFSLILYCCAQYALGQLVIKEAGVNGKDGPVLADGMTFCPELFSPRGFSVLCSASDTATSAEFFVNGERVKKEKASPFYIRGDMNGAVLPWIDFPEDANIRCLQDDGTELSVQLTITCGGVRLPGTLVLFNTGKDGEEVSVLKDGMHICPAEFDTGSFNIMCVGSEESTMATFKVNGKISRREKAKPFFLKGDKDGFIRRWLNPPVDFVVQCSLDDGRESFAHARVACEPDEPPETDDPESTSSCVVVDAKESSLSPGWEEVSDGVGFKLNDVDPTAITRKGVSPLTYSFIAPFTSRYAFVLDMTSANPFDNNDVWVRFPDAGLSLLREKVVKRGIARGYIKAYHNKNGRATVANSVNFFPHSISTFRKLKKGTSYTFEVAGRSSDVILHRIIMFPCKGFGCWKKHPMWKKGLQRCA